MEICLRKSNRGDTSQNTGSKDGWGSSPSIRKSRKSPPSAYALVAPIAPASGSDVIKLKVYTENEPNGVEVFVSLKKDAATPIVGSTAEQKLRLRSPAKGIEMQVVGEAVAWKNGGTGEMEID